METVTHAGVSSSIEIQHHPQHAVKSSRAMPPLAGRAVGAPAALHAEAPQRRGAHLGHSRRALRRKPQWPAPLGVGLLRRLRAGDGDRFQPAAMSAVGASPPCGAGLSCCASSRCQRPGVSTLRASIPRAIRPGRLRRQSSRRRPFPWPGVAGADVLRAWRERRARLTTWPAARARRCASLRCASLRLLRSCQIVTPATRRARCRAA
jgi:hypothetical protein